MAFIQKWLSEQHAAGVAQKVVDETLHYLKEKDDLIDKYVPLKTYESRNFMAYVMQKVKPIASVIAYGTEPPATRLGSFRPMQAELMKTGLSFIYEENFQWEMREALKEAKSKNIMVADTRDKQGNLVKGANQDLAKYLFGSIAQIAEGQVKVLNAMVWQVLQTGRLQRTDPRSGYNVDLNFADPYDTTYNHFPTALSGNDRWTEHATANGIQDLFNACQTYYDTNGFYPKEIAMSRKAINHLLQQESTKSAVNSANFGQIGSVSRTMLNRTLEDREIPPVVAFDAQYDNELANQSTEKVRYMNDNVFVFLTEDVGERAMGPTLENDSKPGVYVVTREIEPIPPTDATQGVATVLPVFVEPKLLYAQQIFDA